VKTFRNRTSVIQISDKGKMLFAIYWYTCHTAGTADQVTSYDETLGQLQTLIADNETSRVMVVGDFNAGLHTQLQSSRQWYKCHPFASHSMLLDDVIVDNE
jgi:hypothetical protein